MPAPKNILSEYDYPMLEARLTLNQPIDDCRLFMVFDGRWKYVHAVGFRPLLFDLAADPHEFRDLGADPGCEGERVRLRSALLDWALRDHNRITTPDRRIAPYAGGQQLPSGILIGYWDEARIGGRPCTTAAQVTKHPAALVSGRAGTAIRS